jgi:hypothetical protein
MPPPLNTNGKLGVTLTLELTQVYNVEELKHEFSAAFSLGINWIDKRVEFNNLEEFIDRNILGPSEKDKIWTPKLVFQNTKNI